MNYNILNFLNLTLFYVSILKIFIIVISFFQHQILINKKIVFFYYFSISIKTLFNHFGLQIIISDKFLFLGKEIISPKLFKSFKIESKSSIIFNLLLSFS